MTNPPYTTQLQAGLGLLPETKTLLNLWSPGMSAADLEKSARETGHFAEVTSRRLKNIVKECFKPRYLDQEAAPARLLQQMIPHVSHTVFAQMCFVFTCRANAILRDFVTQVYWPAYAAGRDVITNEDARSFVDQGIRDHRTLKSWAEASRRRVSAYLTGACADFGLLESGTITRRRIRPFLIEPMTGILLAYELHFQAKTNNQVVQDPDWSLFGLSGDDPIRQLTHVGAEAHLRVQTGGGAVSISWAHQTIEEFANALA